MTTNELRQWIQQQLEALGEPSLGEPLTAENADVVTQLKYNCAAAGLHDLALSLPVEVSKRKISAVCQLRKALETIEAPPPAVDGGALSVAQAARLLGVSPGMVYKLCGEGQLGHRKAGRRILITRQQLESYQGTQTAPAAAGEFRHLRR